MQSIPHNIIPLNEWVDNFDYFIKPMQPGEFDLTPILRARYGNLLRDNIVSIKLFAEHRTVILIITEAGNTEQVIVDFANTMIDRYADSRELDALSFIDGLFFYVADPYDDAPERNAPWEECQAWFNKMLPSLLCLFDSDEVARHLQVFTPHYLALLERIQNNKNDAHELKYENRRLEHELKYENMRLEEAVIFYEDCIQTLAQPIQEKAFERLTSKLANKMKKQDATGILGDDLESYWDEVGVIAYEGGYNLLYGLLCTEIDRKVYDEITSLSEAEQFALWFFGKEVDANLSVWFSGGDYAKNASSAKKDFSLMAENIRDELLGIAVNSLSPEAKEYLGY